MDFTGILYSYIKLNISYHIIIIFSLHKRIFFLYLCKTRQYKVKIVQYNLHKSIFPCTHCVECPCAQQTNQFVYHHCIADDHCGHSFMPISGSNLIVVNNGQLAINLLGNLQPSISLVKKLAKTGCESLLAFNRCCNNNLIYIQ